jgi:hypothetical protein
MADKRNTNAEEHDQIGFGGREGLAAGDQPPCKDEGGGFNMDAWWEERSLAQKIVAGIGFGILGIGALAVFGFVVMLLWNWLMPEIFHLGRVDYWQAWGLLILSSILFKNMGVGNSSSGSSDRKRKKELRRYIREGQSSAEDDPAATLEA